MTKTKSLKGIPPEVLEEYLPTVRYWARHYSHQAHQVLDFDDLQIVGLMGLMDALRRFRPDLNTQFKTYAEFRIRGEIVDELRRQDWMTRSERRKQKTYRLEEKKLIQTLGREPTRTELAKVLPFKPRDFDRMAMYDKQDSLRPYLEGDIVSEDRMRDKVAEVVTIHDEVEELLGHLHEPMRTVLKMRYYDDAPLSEIAEKIGLSEGRVSQLHGEALLILRGEKKAA